MGTLTATYANGRVHLRATTSGSGGESFSDYIRVTSGLWPSDHIYPSDETHAAEIVESVRTVGDPLDIAGIIQSADRYDEVAPHGTVVYSTELVYDDGMGDPIVTTLETGLFVDLGTAWLSWPGADDTHVPVDLVLDLNSTVQAETVVHDVIGRTDPIYLSGITKSRRGDLSLFFKSLADARAAQNLHTIPVLLRTPFADGLDVYYLADPSQGVTLRPASPEGRRWQMDLSYIELTPPWTT